MTEIRYGQKRRRITDPGSSRFPPNCRIGGKKIHALTLQEERLSRGSAFSPRLADCTSRHSSRRRRGSRQLLAASTSLCASAYSFSRVYQGILSLVFLFDFSVYQNCYFVD